MRTARLALLLVPFLLLLGCRDALVDEPLGTGDPAAPGDPAPPTSTIYLKGPSTLLVGETANYRAEATDGAVRYSWVVLGSSTGSLDGVVANTAEGLNRLFHARALDSGTVLLSVAAYNADDERVARSLKEIRVER